MRGILYVDILDVLFDDVHHAFQKASRSDVYLDLLEPYILTDEVKRLAPEVLQACAGSENGNS